MTKCSSLSLGLTRLKTTICLQYPDRASTHNIWNCLNILSISDIIRFCMWTAPKSQIKMKIICKSKYANILTFILKQSVFTFHVWTNITLHDYEQLR